MQAGFWRVLIRLDRGDGALAAPQTEFVSNISISLLG